jgi:hypothetical protein
MDEDPTDRFLHRGRGDHAGKKPQNKTLQGVHDRLPVFGCRYFARLALRVFLATPLATGNPLFGAQNTDFE